jgi:hypothetical protein
MDVAMQLIPHSSVVSIPNNADVGSSSNHLGFRGSIVCCRVCSLFWTESSIPNNVEYRGVRFTNISSKVDFMLLVFFGLSGFFCSFSCSLRCLTERTLAKVSLGLRTAQLDGMTKVEGSKFKVRLSIRRDGYTWATDLLRMSSGTTAGIHNHGVTEIVDLCSGQDVQLFK